MPEIPTPKVEPAHSPIPPIMNPTELGSDQYVTDPSISYDPLKLTPTEPGEESMDGKAGTEVEKKITLDTNAKKKLEETEGAQQLTQMGTVA